MKKKEVLFVSLVLSLLLSYICREKSFEDSAHPSPSRICKMIENQDWSPDLYALYNMHSATLTVFADPPMPCLMKIVFTKNKTADRTQSNSLSWY